MSTPLLQTPLVPEVPVNGEVLKWARKVRGLSLQEATSLLGLALSSELEEYEAGTKKPLVGFLRKVSQRYRINFTSLLMPEPLPIERPFVDHRTRVRDYPLTMDSLVAIEEVSEALDAFADLAEEKPHVVPALRIGTATLDDDPDELAVSERRRFRVGVDEQHDWGGLATARRNWRQRIEDRGVFTYMIPLQHPNEISGFSLLRDGVAAICVNDREPTEGAKTFTLFHEYCHLLLRQGSVSDENNSNRVERFCNQFAASFLIPFRGLVEAIGDVETPYEFSDGDVKRLAAQFRVSNRAVALRLQETGLAPDGFYGRRTAPWDLPAPPKPSRPGSQPSYTTLRIKRIGKLHTSTVIRARKRGLINSFDATDLTGLQPKTLGKLQLAGYG